MTRDELVDELTKAGPDPGAVVYVERSGEQYSWRVADGFAWPLGDPAPDAWIYFSGAWPGHQGRPAFVEDLLAEMEAMVAAGDRCRWPLDDPWPHAH